MISSASSIAAGISSGLLISESARVGMKSEGPDDRIKESAWVQINLVNLLAPWTNWRVILSSGEETLPGFTPSAPVYAIPLTLSATCYLLKEATANKLTSLYGELRTQDEDSSWKVFQVCTQKALIKAALGVRSLLNRIPFFSSGVHTLRTHLHHLCAVALVAEGGFALLKGPSLFAASMAGGAALNCLGNAGHLTSLSNEITGLACLFHSLVSGDLVQKCVIVYIASSALYDSITVRNESDPPP